MYISISCLTELCSQIRKMVDDFYQFTKELQNQAPFLNDLLEQCAVFEEQVNCNQVRDLSGLNLSEVSVTCLYIY